MDLTAELHRRHFDTQLHTAWLDEEECVATFPLWNLQGQLKGYQVYRPGSTEKKANDPRTGRYYSYMVAPVWWGFESWKLSPGLLFVTEGVFDAARLTSRGYSALATLSNDPGREFRNFVFTCGRRVVVVADNDANGSGKKLVKYGHQSVFCEDGKDLGDTSDDYVDWLLKKFS